MHSVEEQRLAVVTPVFNDWDCVNELVVRFAERSEALPPMNFIIVDDGSLDPPTFQADRWGDRMGSVQVVRSGTNLGHQRAIALGITQAVAEPENTLILVIDSDGEDDPADSLRLLSALRDAPTELAAAVAQRNARSEALKFKAFYRLYKVLFRLLTGRRLDFGNYCLMPAEVARRLVYMPELWNHFPAAIMRSRIAVLKVPTDRRTRYYGTSTMNFVALVNHGLAAIATFTDVVFARLLVVVSILIGLCVAGGAVVIGIRLGTDLAIPGWTTVMLGFLLLALFQLLAMLAMLTFMVLAARSTISPVPARVASDYIRGIDEIRGGASAT